MKNNRTLRKNERTVLKMGLAASQARLLTITARLADNELRSQTINNAKMRLATQSAQASDEYVSALNNAQMMFSNTTPDGLTQSQALSFNALTQYSPYNTQYGIVNTAGQIMVSEEDAKIFEGCNNDLEKFLKAHNLEWKTTFFDESSGDLQAKLTSFYGTGDRDIGYLFGKTNEQLKEIYLLSQSQDAAIETLNYSIVAKQFHTAVVNIYKSTVGEFTDYLFGSDKKPSDAINGIISDWAGQPLPNIKNHLLNDPKYGLNNLHSNGMITQSAYEKWGPLINSLNYYTIGSGVQAAGYANSNVYPLTAPMSLSYGVTVTSNTDEYGNIIDYTVTNGGAEAKLYQGTVEQSSITGTDLATLISSISIVPNDIENYPAFAYYIEGGNAYEIKLKYNTSGTQGYVDPNTVTSNMIGEYLNALWKEGSFDPFGYMQAVGGPVTPALLEYGELQANYEKYGIQLSLPAESNMLVDFEKYVKEYDHSKVLSLANTNEQYRSVLYSYMADKMLDVLGEPKYTWIDSSDTTNTGNAEAKAKWLTNLFNRMQKGYKVLENGLAKSTEWLEYALESGLVTMEQVDLSQNWNALDYKSCANIFEQTDNSAAVAKAEAKYNRAMNDIKQKDSLYDLQLKNIDTEHNALQTEYDVIKGVISKNIERTMKFNQSA